jgi:hypothetical protein
LPAVDPQSIQTDGQNIFQILLLQDAAKPAPQQCEHRSTVLLQDLGQRRLIVGAQAITQPEVLSIFSASGHPLNLPASSGAILASAGLYAGA